MNVFEEYNEYKKEYIMKLRNILLAVCLLAIPARMSAYITGYDRLFDHRTNKIVDILYDEHVQEKSLSERDIKKKGFNYIKNRLYKTERRFLDILATINTNAPGQVDLVWEYGLKDGGEDQFIGAGKCLVKKQFKNINFICADTSRDAFQELLLSDQNRHPNKQYKGVSFQEPMPLPDVKKVDIFKNSGKDAWLAYEKLHADTIARVKAEYADDYLRGYDLSEEDFEEENAFDALADIEMLSHVLASPTSHVIVYAGGWHSRRISGFLKKCGYKRLHRVSDGDGQVSPNALNRIGSGYGFTAVKPYKESKPVKKNDSKPYKKPAKKNYYSDYYYDDDYYGDDYYDDDYEYYDPKPYKKASNKPKKTGGRKKGKGLFGRR